MSDCTEGYKPVYAKPDDNPAGIVLEKGKRYYFRTTGTWQDSERVEKCDADGYCKWYLTVLGTFLLRSVISAPWFCLIGKVNGKKFRMGKAGDFIAKESGPLSCFANDVSFMRGNNLGNICLQIQDKPFTD